MQEVKIDKNTKGVLVLAKPNSKCPYDEDWVLLIESVYPSHWKNGVKVYEIRRHASYCLCKDENDFCAFVSERPQNWGDASHYKFYKPTKKQRDLMKNFIAKKGFKFDKKNNKLIKYDRSYC